MKPINFDVELKSTSAQRQFTREKAMTNDLNSVDINYKISDMTAEDLTGATAQVLLYMMDGSFFQIGNEKITLVGTTFTYVLEEAPGNHAGIARTQIIVKTSDLKEYASQKLEFEIISGLETQVATEVMIHDWTSLTREARAYIDEFKLIVNDAKEQVQANIVETAVEEKFNNLEQEYATDLTQVKTELADIATDFDNVIANATTDSEVIISRGNHTTLGNRLDHIEDNSADKVKVASIEKDLKSYQSTMASVNVNQEAKQSVTGYGNVNLPKNCANGQVSASVKGRTLKNELNYNHDTWAEWEGSITSRDSSGIVITDGAKHIALPTSLKPSTKYGILTNVISNNFTGNLNSLTSALGAYFICTAGQTGNFKNVVTSVATITTNKVGYVTGNGTGIIKLKDIRVFELPTGSEIETDFNTMTADQLAQKYPYIQGGNAKSTISASRLKSVGKNLFDGEMEIGSISSLDGTNNIDNTKVRTKGFIKVKPNNLIHFGKNGIKQTVNVRTYDINKQFISASTVESITLPNNCHYIRFMYTETLNNAVNLSVSENTLLTPYEPYIESTSYLPNVGELRNLPNGVRDEIRVSESKLINRIDEELIRGSQITGVSVSYANTYLATISNWNSNNKALKLTTGSGIGYSADGEFSVLNSASLDQKGIVFGNDLSIKVEKSKIDSQTGTTILEKFKAYLNQYPITLTYQLATPVENPIEVSGTLLSNPSGTIYVENVVADAGIHNNGLSVLNQGLPIKEIESISKVDFTTGVETKLDISKAVISTDKLSFTHPDLVDGDIVFFTYFHDVESTQGELEVEYYDSRHTVKDKTLTNKFYQWKIEVDNGVPSIKLVEV